jgi:5'-nucleotidase (lipoprotein e(P4) family)
MPPTIVWTRASAEHRALYLEVYRAAAEQLELRTRTLPRGSWAVVLDADETVLDNSVYQQERARISAGFSADSWNAWVSRVAATALPGAASFLARVHELGGRVAIVTNRNEDQCGATRENLRRASLDADLVLCAPPGQSDKNPRFRAIEQGTATPTVPPLHIVMWIGDNIQDFPNMRQDVRLAPDSALTEFGKTYFVLPNPMYGSWERNALPH